MPYELNLRGVAGDPRKVTINFAGVTITSPTVKMKRAVSMSSTLSGVGPTVSLAGNSVTIDWSAANTTALRAIAADTAWSLAVTANGQGPFQAFAGDFHLDPVGSASSDAASSTYTATVQLGTLTVTATIVLGAGSLPAGGATGAALVKSSTTDYDTAWAALAPVATSGSAADLTAGTLPAARVALATDGQILTRAGGVLAPISRASLFADPAATSSKVNHSKENR